MSKGKIVQEIVPKKLRIGIVIQNGTIDNALEGPFCCLKPFQFPYTVKHSTNVQT